MPDIKSEIAHDSLWDTRATKDLGHLLLQNAPEVFNASIALRKKEDVLSRIKDDIFCWNEFFFAKAKVFCGCYLGSTIYPNWHYLFDLRQSPEEIVNIMNNRDELKKRVETSPRFIRICKGNRSPIIMGKENAFNIERNNWGTNRYNLDYYIYIHKLSILITLKSCKLIHNLILFIRKYICLL